MHAHTEPPSTHACRPTRMHALAHADSHRALTVTLPYSLEGHPPPEGEGEGLNNPGIGQGSSTEVLRLSQRQVQSAGAWGDPSECFECFPGCVSTSALLLFMTVVYGVGFPGFHRTTRMRKQTLLPGRGGNSFPDQLTLGQERRGDCLGVALLC